MKARFKGGPWNGLERDFPTLPQWISFGTMDWDSNNQNTGLGQTMVLATPADYLYVLRSDGTAFCYELRIVEGD